MSHHDSVVRKPLGVMIMLECGAAPCRSRNSLVNISGTILPAGMKKLGPDAFDAKPLLIIVMDSLGKQAPGGN